MKLRFFRALATVSALIIVATGMAAFDVPQAEAATASQFNPGFIISDQNFFDGTSMSPADVQTFLNSRLDNCVSGYVCLKDYSQAVPVRAAEPGLCAGYVASPSQSAAEIISRTGASCGVSPKVLIVLLEKEQSLVTSASPSTGRYNSATGFGCPDTAPCDVNVAGFFYQVYNAARQLRNYGLNPDQWNYRSGATTEILFNPNRACGSAPVYLANRATAALYNYTPYQPNASAMANLYGWGDACGAYGNRNFWRIFTDWFGPTTAPLGTPEASYVASSTPSTVSLKGWAVDPDSVTSPVVVSAQIGSMWQSFTANASGSSLSNQYPGAGGNHYFDVSFPSPPGLTTVCLYMPNVGGAGSMGAGGCQTVLVSDPPSPMGEITDARANLGSIDVSGWAIRPDSLSGLVNVAANVGSQWIQLTSGQANGLAPMRVEGAGPSQGFSGTIPASPGVQNVCIWASATNGGAVLLNCRTVNVPVARETLAHVDAVTVVGDIATITGWAIWPDSPTATVQMAINIGPAWYPIVASLSNAGAAIAQPAAGAMHGFTVSVHVPAGATPFCLWAHNQSTGATPVACRTAYSGATLPPAVVELESVSGAADSVTFSGWSMWPGSPSSSVRLAAEMNGAWYPIDANQPSAAAQASIPSSGNHGFSGSIPVSQGPHNFCLWATQPSGPAVFVSCTPIVVSSLGKTTSDINGVYGVVGGVRIDGWAAATNSPAAVVRIAGNIGSAWFPIDTGIPNAVAGTRVPGAGANQGFSSIMPAAPGPHNICIWVAGASGATQESCVGVVVPPTPDFAGALVDAVGVAGGVSVSGWTVWPSAPGTAVNTSASFGNQWTSLTRGVANPAAQGYVLGAGPNQGFSGVIPTPSGAQTVCVWGSRPSGPAAVLGCRTVTVP